MRKKVTFAACIIFLAVAFIIAPGFMKQGNVYISEYSISEDGSKMDITVGVASSMGYVRKVAEHQQHGGKLYLDCYSAFGGINGSLGAKKNHTIELDEDTKSIGLYRSKNAYEIVLEKDASGEWKKV